MTANSKQVGMLLAIARSKGLGKVGFLEWLEYESGLGVRVADPYSLLANQVTMIKAALERLSDASE
jgi:hypothetical protein